MLLIFFYCLVALVSILVDLNGFMGGRWKNRIDAILSILMILLIVIMFVFFGWIHGVISIGALFLTAVLFLPIAPRAAIWLTSDPDTFTRFLGMQSRRLQIISKVLGRELKPKGGVPEFLLDSQLKDRALEDLVDYCFKQKALKPVLEHYGTTKQELVELYWELVKNSAGLWVYGHWLPASALAYQESLRFLLGNKGKPLDGIALLLMEHFTSGASLLAENMNWEDPEDELDDE
jgi:hypothetical protein